MSETVICHEHGKDENFKIWHALDEHMFIYTYTDGGSIVCNEKIYPIKKGTLCFIGAGKYHYTMPDNPEIYDRSKLFVKTDILARVLKNFTDKNKIKHFSEGSLAYSIIAPEDQDEIDCIFGELEKYVLTDYDEEVTIACCIKLIALINRNSIEQVAPVSGAMNKAVDYINRNIFKDISIDEICNGIHMSKYHFCRRFREHTGMTVMNYILKTRIVQAKNLLVSEKISVSDVSQRCGFSSLSYFCRVFKEETGMTPLEFKKENVQR